MPQICRVLETALYVDDLSRANSFYTGVLGLRAIFESERLVALDAGGATVLLLFKRGATLDGVSFANGGIPPHDGAGPAHFALAIDSAAYSSWCTHLETANVAIESEVQWGRGGKSIYFRDPDGHSVELATPGVWETY